MWYSLEHTNTRECLQGESKEGLQLWTLSGSVLSGVNGICKIGHHRYRAQTAMVNKASDLFETGRFKYDISNKAIPLAFMTIYETTTAKTGQITYASRETQEAGHGDLAWAYMHAFMCEELVPERLGVTGSVH